MNCPKCRIGFIRIIDFHGPNSKEMICDKCLNCFEESSTNSIEFSDGLTKYCKWLDYRGILHKRVLGYPMFVPNKN